LRFNEPIFITPAASSDYPALRKTTSTGGHYESGVLPWLGHIGMRVDPLIHGGYLHELADAYLPDAVDRKDARVSPLYADLTGLPHILI